MEVTKVLYRKKLLVPILRFKEFSSEWETKKYKELTTLVTNGFVGKAKDFYVESNGITYIQGYNVVEGGFNLRGIKQVSKDFHKKNKKSVLVEGDLLTIQTGDIGTTTIVTKELAGSNCHALVISRFKQELASPYFYMLLFNSQRGRNQLKTIETGSTMKHLNVGDIIDLVVQFPTLPEQQKISSFLSAVDEKIQRLIHKNELLEQYKKGVMQQLFSGKLRFKDENGMEFPKWEKKLFKDFVIDYRLGGNYQNTEELTIYPLIKMGNLDRGKIKIDKIEYIPINEPIDPKDEIKYGDLFFNTRNTLDLVGKVAIWRNELPKAYYNSNLMYLKFENNFFMNYRLNSYDGVKALKRFATGTTSVAAIYTKDLLKLELLIPCLEEQKKIANFLSSIDSKIEMVNNQITQTQTFKKGLLQQMFV